MVEKYRCPVCHHDIEGDLVVYLDHTKMEMENILKKKYTNWKKEKGQKEYGSEFVRTKGQLSWANALYLRTPQQLPKEMFHFKNRILNTIAIYFVFGYPDLVQDLVNMAGELISKDEKIYVNNLLNYYPDQLIKLTFE